LAVSNVRVHCPKTLYQTDGKFLCLYLTREVRSSTSVHAMSMNIAYCLV